MFQIRSHITITSFYDHNVFAAHRKQTLSLYDGNTGFDSIPRPINKHCKTKNDGDSHVILQEIRPIIGIVLDHLGCRRWMKLVISYFTSRPVQLRHHNTRTLAVRALFHPIFSLIESNP